jgi:glutaredoxin
MSRILLVVLSLLALSVQAATYRWVDADGRVTYGDRPPANGAWLVQDTDGDGGVTPPTAAGALPYALRSATNRFPVRLYTSGNCASCEAARALLTQRGVPFTERVLRTEADLTAFRRLGFAENQTPAISVGRERTQVFRADEWQLLLDAAGYPKTSMLPRGWRSPAATPLAPASPPAEGIASRAMPAGDGSPDSGASRADAGQRSVSAQAALQAQAVPERPYATPQPTRREPLPEKQPASNSTSAIRF